MLTFKVATMKKSISIIIVFCLFLTACKKQLTQEPISDLSSDLFWKTAEHAMLGNAAIYDGIQKTLSGNYTEWGDARSDNFTFGGTGENQINISLNGLNATTGAANWNNLYMTIGRTNSAIKYLPSIKDLGDVSKNHFLAQAYTARAYLYWYAVRVWGDVPVRLAPYEDINEEPNVVRSPADSVINSIIIPDLQNALALADKNATNVWEISRGAILSMLTEIHLWKKDYAKVISTTDELIALKKYDLAPAATYKEIFITASTKENIWSLHWNYLVDGGNGISRLGSSGNTANYYIDSIPLSIWQNNKTDIRRAINYDTIRANSLQEVNQIFKFAPQPDPLKRPVLPGTTQNEAKLVLYRWADIILMRAEAINRANNDKTGAINIVNQVRTRAIAGNVDPLKYNNFASQADVEKAILDERQLELFAEGKRWFDLVRTGQVMQVMDPLIRQRQKRLGLTENGFTDPRKILWPISRAAMVRNLLLVQNPPYSE